MKQPLGLLLLVAAVICAAGCSTTSSGINRQQIVNNSPKSLPFKVIVSEKGKDIESVGTAEQVNYKELLPLFGLSSFGIAQLAKNETAIAAIRGRFAAGQAFEETGRARCSPDSGASMVKLELLHFKHFGSAKKPGYVGVSGLMQFSSELIGSHQTTISSYAFVWYTKGTFFASQERDILREIMENALEHWGQQFGDVPSAAKGVTGFPGPGSGQFTVGTADYVYDIFKPIPDKVGPR